VLLLLPVGAACPAPQDAEPAPPERDEPGTLRFEILDDATGRPIPARLTFLGGGGPGARLFRDPGVDPRNLALRDDIVVTLRGRGAVEVPPGRYRILASRGLEWSVASKEVTIEAGREARFSVRLRREVDTTGWIAGDFHLHTLTYSGHGDANLEERMITLAGEGVEFAVATDHNHHTDYGPTIRALEMEKELTAITGNEVSVPIGHMNAFPLEPEGPVPDPAARDARTLFRFIRAQTNRYGVVPVLQINHPRWEGIDYFGKTSLDPVTGRPGAEFWSDDFDSIEVLNENAGWGYHDADAPGAPPAGSTRHSVLRDWFQLLNRGRRVAAVGNSDSHHVRYILAGYPRNYVRSSTDVPGEIDPVEIVEAIRTRRLFTTTGPFVDFEASGVPMGGETKVRDGLLELRLRVQAASWIDCDRVRVVVNGDLAAEIPVPASREAVRLDVRREIPVDGDGWVVLLVEGDDPLSPVVHDGPRPVRPIAVANPVWFDGDEDGRWTPPFEQAVAFAREASASELTARIRGLEGRPFARMLLVLAAAEAASPEAARAAATRALEDTDRLVRLGGARAAERLAAASLASAVGGALDRALDASPPDPFLAVSLLRALAACDASRLEARVVSFLERADPGSVTRYRDDLEPLLPGSFVTEWRTVRYFPNPSPDTLVTTDFGPEAEDGSARESFEGKGGAPVGWTEATASSSGYLDLRPEGEPREIGENAIAYAEIWLEAPEDREVLYALGTDDGCRLWVNNELLFEDNTRHGANPLAQVGRMRLRAGWNRVLVKIENGAGGFGLYFRVLDAEVRSVREPR
jgi:hypothetical protein